MKKEKSICSNTHVKILVCACLYKMNCRKDSHNVYWLSQSSWMSLSGDFFCFLPYTFLYYMS